MRMSSGMKRGMVLRGDVCPASAQASHWEFRRAQGNEHTVLFYCTMVYRDEHAHVVWDEAGRLERHRDAVRLPRSRLRDEQVSQGASGAGEPSLQFSL